MRDADVFITNHPTTRHTLFSRFCNKQFEAFPKVRMATYYAGADTAILDALEHDCDGIVIIGTGSGNYSQAWLQKLDELAEKGTIIVRSSRVPHSIVFDEQVFDPKNHFIGSNTLTPFKARILLMLCLTQTRDIEKIRDAFFRY